MTQTDPGAEGDPSASRQRFCRRCQKHTAPDDSLCPECGDQTLPKGYCSVCDRFLLRAEGDLCPKHDVPLEGMAPPPRSQTLDGEFTDWVRIETYAEPMAAQAGRIRLEAEGIPTFLEGERMGGHGLYGVAIGGVRLMVPREVEHEARVLLSQTWSPPQELEDDLDGAWEDLAPEPGSRRREVMKAAIVVILAIPLIRALAAVLLGA